MRRISLPVLLLATACGPTYVDFAYPPNRIERARPTELKIAVLPFRDERKTYDEGSTKWTWLPGVPYATERRDARQEPHLVSRAEYFYPGLVAYSIAVDLAHNRLAGRVDLAPPALEDYDVAVHGTLHRFEEAYREITYGLGPLSFFRHWLPVPKSQQMVAFEATYVAYDSSGQAILERRVTEEWDDLALGSGDVTPAMHGRVLSLQQANREFLEALGLQLDDEPFADSREAIRRRVQRYHDQLDPELARLVAARARHRAAGVGHRREERAIGREIQRRAKLLEIYRKTEDRIIGAQQAEVWRQFERSLVDTAEVRRTQRDVEARQAELERQAFHAAMRPLAGALVAGALPAVASARATGDFGAAQWDMLAKDISASMAALPPPPAPPPDLRPLLDEIGADRSRGDDGAALIGGIRAKSVPELRRKFLRLYAKKRVPLARIEAAMMRSRARVETGATTLARDPS